MRFSNARLSRSLSLTLALLGLLTPLVVPASFASRAAGSRAASRAETTARSAAAPTQAAQMMGAQAQAAYAKLPLQFEANQGQSDAEVDFITRTGGATVFLTRTGVVSVLRLADESGAASRGESLQAGKRGRPEAETSAEAPRMAVLRMKLEGANSQPAVSGLDELEGKVNYFIGDDAAKWRTNIPTFGRVRYASVYEGVDMVYYGNGQRQLEYDFEVRPGTDYRQIAFSFEGADKVEVEAASGALLLRVGETTLRQPKPVVYQEVAGERVEIESGYDIKGGGRVGFAVGEYDARRPLVIDPVLAYSTYLGGSGVDNGKGIAVDAAGNAYVTGWSTSTNFPTANAIQGTMGGGFNDAFVMKLNAAGSALVYSTYLGGGGGDQSSGIAVDAAGNAYVAGLTDSTNFPTANAFQATYGGGNFDAFVAKLNASGAALVYSTYLGGGADDLSNGIAVDTAGNAYVTGETTSTNFPTANAIQGTIGGGFNDAFVTKLNAAGSALVYSTYLGGDSTDPGFGIAVDTAGNAYVTGQTASTNFPTANAIQGSKSGGADAFVTKLNASGSARVYSTYLGGGSGDSGNGIAVDTVGNAYVIGGTSSTDFPTANAIQGTFGGSSDAFVTKLNASGSALVYSTYLGGSVNEKGNGIAVDAAGNAYVTGRTASANFPTANAIQGTYGGGGDGFVTKLNATGAALVYSTYLGGGSGDSGDGIAADTAGNTYVTGLTDSTDFPTTANALQATSAAGNDAFIAKLGSFAISGRVIDSGGNGISGVTVTLSGANSAITTTDAGGNFLFLNTTPGGEYNVTPFKAGFTFSPETLHIFNLDSNRDLLFIGTSSGSTTAQVQFEFDNYIAPEDCDGIDIAVTRTGDTSGAVTIDYATSDGTAKQKSDYGITLGTLSFAPGDTRKTITVVITEDAFVEGDEQFTLNLFNLVGASTLQEPSRTTVTIADDDTTATNVNPIDDSEVFVCQHYHDFLNREPDTAGELYWINNIESCGTNASCREVKRIDTSAAFFLSIEFQGTGFYAIRLQRTAFGKRSDTATTRMTYQDLARDTRQLGNGVIIGQAGADAKLEQNKQVYATQVVNSAVFISRFPTSQTAAQYVDALYASAQVTPTATERTDAITAFGGGGIAGRVAALRKVVESQSLVNAEARPAFVLLQYHGYLRRNPTDLPDANDSGYQFWLAKLNSFGGDFRAAEMVKSFITSTEYRQRFGS